jgi:aspartyl-tRNA(Asn)/glutamyl-tRNA(Gln) amidotransferase subunit B
MDEGSMRADVNVSVRRAGEGFGTRTETKNVNSVRFIAQTVEHEAKRQVALIESGGAVVQETRLFDPGTGTTRPMRSKEDAHDYRYFPDPDLLPVELSEEFVLACERSLPELPAAKRTRYTESLGLTSYLAGVLMAEKTAADWYEALVAELAARRGKKPEDVARTAANWATGELFGALKRLGLEIEASPVSPSGAAELLALVDDGTISGSVAKTVFEAMLETGDCAGAIVEAKGLRQVSDTGAIDTAIAQVLAANADKVEQYRGGKEALFGFFVGQTMKAMGGKANPALINERLKAALAG